MVLFISNNSDMMDFERHASRLPSMVYGVRDERPAHHTANVSRNPHFVLAPHMGTPEMCLKAKSGNLHP